VSRTRKTMPGAVRMGQNMRRLTREHHDHRDGVCNLGVGPARREQITWKSGECYLEGTNEYWYGRDSGCPCWMCSNNEWYGQEWRRHRKETKREMRAYVKALNSGVKEYL
jgi:hypothetical protein